MDGVERIMVLGIFAVIVAILSIAAWGVTNDEGGSVFATDGGVTARPSETVVLGGSDGAPTDDEGRSAGQAEPQVGGGGAPQTRGQPPAGPGSRNPPRLVQGGEDSGARPGAQRATRDLVGPGSDLKLSKPVPVGRPPAEPAPEPEDGAGPAPKPQFKIYTVVKGDTVWSIARDLFGEGDTKGQVKLIQQLNPAVDIDDIGEGDELKLPLEVPENVVSKPVEKQAKAGTRLYTIGPGETLTSIAKEQLGDGKRSGEIYQLNRQTIANPDTVYDGMTILLPDR